MTAKEKLRARVEDLSEQEAKATLECIASRSQSFGAWLDSRPEDDESLSPEERAALAVSDAEGWIRRLRTADSVFGHPKRHAGARF